MSIVIDGWNVDRIADMPKCDRCLSVVMIGDTPTCNGPCEPIYLLESVAVKKLMGDWSVQGAVRVKIPWWKLPKHILHDLYDLTGIDPRSEEWYWNTETEELEWGYEEDEEPGLV